MSRHTTSPTSSSSTLIVSPLPLDHHPSGTPLQKKPVINLVIAPSSGWSFPEGKRMSGKGFVEPHRNNLPRRKRRVVTAPEDIALRDATTQSSTSSSVDTNITEPPSSHVLSAPLHKVPSLSDSPPIFPSSPTFQTPQPAPFRGRHLDDAFPLQITPTKGHLQPTPSTLPRRFRSLQRRRVDADADLVSNSDSRSVRRRQSICAQELSEGIILGFLTEEDEHAKNIVRIKVYDDSPPSPSSVPGSSSSSSLPHLQLSLPTDPLSYIDGTTCLTDSQLQQACTFIDEHVSIPLADPSSSTTLVPTRRISVLILAPRVRPEEAMSIGICYLAGKENMNKGVEGSGDGDDGGDLNDNVYSTVHRLLMTFHDDDPGSPNLGAKELEASELEEGDATEKPSFMLSGIVTKGLRAEWRGVLSFDGMRRLDKVWTCNFKT